MPQCEMCGPDQASLKTVKVEGAELQLRDDCVEFSTEVRTESISSASAKYSTTSSSGSNSSHSSGSSSPSSSKTRRRDMSDDMDEIATDYDDRIRQAWESRGLSQEELAQPLNEKTSLIRKIERGDIMPSDSVRKKIEHKLDTSLVEGESSDDSEWSGGGSTATTLGDVIKWED